MENDFWRAVETRDTAADGQFVYAVKTTGVYCRPSCPSRKALRKNVVFFENPTAAASAGYRACKRCHPDIQDARINLHTEAVKLACELIKQSDEALTLKQLAKAVGLSPFYFHRTFKRITGVTPKSYTAELRAAKLRTGLSRGQKVTEAIYGAGYGASSRFYEEASQRLGMDAADYRKGAPGTTIWFALAETTLGTLSVAATNKGVCAIEFGEDPEALIQSLQDRFPHAELIGGDAAFERLVARVCAYVERPVDSLNLPIDVQGTAFQQRVWTALQSIPVGQTRSYAEVAETIGAPMSHRAVARACAANPVAIAIPCHRVVRTDGGLSGYRWGVDRKAALLDREATA